MNSLDVLASRAVFAARLFERAVHDAGPWTVQWGPFDVPAVKVTDAAGVHFLAHLPEHCFLVAPPGMATLLCGGDVVSVRDVSCDGDGSFDLDWLIGPVLSPV